MPGDGIHYEADPVLNGNETVLVVDDIEDIRSFLNEALPMFGYSVICAEDGLDGLNNSGRIKTRFMLCCLI